jgi:hypothetical protein
MATTTQTTATTARGNDTRRAGNRETLTLRESAQRGKTARKAAPRAGWSAGARPRFGLHRVDYATQQRTPRPSAEFFRACTTANAVS